MLDPILVELLVVIVMEVMLVEAMVVAVAVEVIVVVIGMVGEVGEMVVVAVEMAVVAVVEQDFYNLQRYPVHQYSCHHFLEIVFGLLMAEGGYQIRIECNGD